MARQGHLGHPTQASVSIMLSMPWPRDGQSLLSRGLGTSAPSTGDGALGSGIQSVTLNQGEVCSPSLVPGAVLLWTLKGVGSGAWTVTAAPHGKKWQCLDSQQRVTVGG